MAYRFHLAASHRTRRPIWAFWRGWEPAIGLPDHREIRAGADLIDVMQSGRGHVLVYVGGGAAKPGTMLPLPYFDGRGRTIVKRSARAKPGVWFDESADMRADFPRAFGRTPGQLVAVAVSSDSDDTGGRNRATLPELCVK